jgi:hypothetical protein
MCFNSESIITQLFSLLLQLRIFPSFSHSVKFQGGSHGAEIMSELKPICIQHPNIGQLAEQTE